MPAGRGRRGGMRWGAAWMRAKGAAGCCFSALHHPAAPAPLAPCVRLHDLQGPFTARQPRQGGWDDIPVPAADVDRRQPPCAPPPAAWHPPDTQGEARRPALVRRKPLGTWAARTTPDAIGVHAGRLRLPGTRRAVHASKELQNQLPHSPRPTHELLEAARCGLHDAILLSWVARRRRRGGRLETATETGRGRWRSGDEEGRRARRSMSQQG